MNNAYMDRPSQDSVLEYRRIDSLTKLSDDERPDTFTPEGFKASLRALTGIVNPEWLETALATVDRLSTEPSTATEGQTTADIWLEQVCLVCGAKAPCMKESDLKPDDPGTPCTFEPECVKRAFWNGVLQGRAEAKAEPAPLGLDLTVSTPDLPSEIACNAANRLKAEIQALKGFCVDDLADVYGIIQEEADKALTSWPVGGLPTIDDDVEAVWTYLRERCCATKPPTDAKRVVMVGRDDIAAALLTQGRA